MGKCLEQPAEPADSTFKDRIKHVAYPVEYLGGLIYAYLGPAPVPLLPRWDVLGVGAWQTLDRQGIDHRVQLAAADGKLRRPVASVLAARRHGASRAACKNTPRSMNSFASNTASKNGATTLPLATGAEPAVDEHPLLFPSVLRHVAPFNEGQWTSSQLTDPRASGRLSHSGFSRKFRSVRDRTLAARRAECRFVSRRSRPDRESTR